MHRIDSPGAVAVLPATDAVGATVGYFSEGNPVTSTAATRVSKDWLNAVQEEIVGVILDAGLTLDKTNRAQLLAAIKSIVQNNNDIAAFTVANNQSVAANVTGLVFDKTAFKSAIIEYDMYRKDAGQETTAIGKLMAIYKPVADTWELQGPEEFGDDCGVEFSITSAGQIQYTSTNFGGGSYSGTMRIKVKRFKI